jgi:hypothetical protein
MAFFRGDFTAVNAFLWLDTTLAPYAGNDSGLTPYSILLTDAAGKTARGFIGAVGAGETLSGIEKIPDPHFNNGVQWYVQDPGWVVSGGVATATSTSNKRVACYIGNQTPSALYKLSINIVSVASGTFLGESMALAIIPASATTGVRTGYLTWAALISYDISFKGNSSASGVIDDASFQRVLDPPSTGVHIVSAYGGSTRAWTTIESGFNPNTITTAVVIQVAFSGTASISGGGTLTSLGQKGGLGLALISGAGAMASTGAKGGQGAAVISGNGLLASLGIKAGQGAAVLSAGGHLIASGISWWYDRSRLSISHRVHIGRGRTLQKL